MASVDGKNDSVEMLFKANALRNLGFALLMAEGSRD